MKRNAIVRIILFSITIVVLLGILLACLGIGKYASTHEIVTEYHVGFIEPDFFEFFHIVVRAGRLLDCLCF